MLDGNNEARSKYCRDNILDIMVCESIPESSPGRLNPAIAAEAPGGRSGWPGVGGDCESELEGWRVAGGGGCRVTGAGGCWELALGLERIGG